MPLHAPRYIVVVLLAVATAGAAAVAVTVSVSTAHASHASHASHAEATSACQPHTKGIGGDASGAQIARTMQANIPNACGFTVTGEFLGADFGIDGMTLAGPTSYDGQGQAHVLYGTQGSVLDFYRAGGADYVRLYEYDAPAAVPDGNLRALWSEFGVSSGVVHKAGSTRWVKLTAAEQQAFGHSDMIGVLATPSSLAAALAAGTGATWELSGNTVIDGTECAAITDPANGGHSFVETIYVNEQTGLPVMIRYSVRQGNASTANFSHWSSTAAITPPAQVAAAS